MQRRLPSPAGVTAVPARGSEPASRRPASHLGSGTQISVMRLNEHWVSSGTGRGCARIRDCSHPTAAVA